MGTQKQILIVKFFNNFINKSFLICSFKTSVDCYYICFYLNLPPIQQYMHRPNFKFNRNNKEAINQMNESKQIDPTEKQLENYREDQKPQSSCDNNQQRQQFFSIQKQKKTHQITGVSKKYATNNLTQNKTISKLQQYNSGIYPSTQAASPYNKFQTDSDLKDQIKTELLSQNKIKKKLFYKQSELQTSPQFTLRQSKYDALGATFRKKIDNYPRLFSEKSPVQPQSNERKIQFSRIDLSMNPKFSDLKQNSSYQLNFKSQKEQENFVKIKKKLDFESVSLTEQNPILQKIKQQIKRDRGMLQQEQTDYKISRRNQTDLIKRKILESKSDLKRFYQMDSNNVEYEYRKAKFMDIFLGPNIIGHNLR